MGNANGRLKKERNERIKNFTGATRSIRKTENYEATKQSMTRDSKSKRNR